MGNLPPYTNVSLKMILTNPEGRKESDETIIQTDEDGEMNLFIYLVLKEFIIYDLASFCYKGSGMVHWKCWST